MAKALQIGAKYDEERFQKLMKRAARENEHPESLDEDEISDEFFQKRAADVLWLGNLVKGALETVAASNQVMDEQNALLTKLHESNRNLGRQLREERVYRSNNEDLRPSAWDVLRWVKKKVIERKKPQGGAAA